MSPPDTKIPGAVASSRLADSIIAATSILPVSLKFLTPRKLKLTPAGRTAYAESH